MMSKSDQNMSQGICSSSTSSPSSSNNLLKPAACCAGCKVLSHFCSRKFICRRESFYLLAAVLVTVILIISLTMITYSLVHATRGQSIAAIKQKESSFAANYSERLTNVMNIAMTSISEIHGLMMGSLTGNPEHDNAPDFKVSIFDFISERILNRYNGQGFLFLAPENKVRQIYPQNDKMVEIDLFRSDLFEKDTFTSTYHRGTDANAELFTFNLTKTEFDTVWYFISVSPVYSGIVENESPLWGLVGAFIELKEIVDEAHFDLIDAYANATGIKYVVCMRNASDYLFPIVASNDTISINATQEELHAFQNSGRSAVIQSKGMDMLLSVNCIQKPWNITGNRLALFLFIEIGLPLIAFAAFIIVFFILNRKYNAFKYAPKYPPFAILKIGPRNAQDLWSLAPKEMSTAAYKWIQLLEKNMKKYHAYQVPQVQPYVSTFIFRSIDEAVLFARSVMQVLLQDNREIDSELVALLGEDSSFVVTCVIHWCTDATVTVHHHEELVQYHGPDVLLGSKLWVVCPHSCVVLSKGAKEMLSETSLSAFQVQYQDSVLVKGFPSTQDIFFVMGMGKPYHGNHMRYAADMGENAFHEEDMLSEFSSTGPWMECRRDQVFHSHTSSVSFQSYDFSSNEDSDDEGLFRSRNPDMTNTYYLEGAKSGEDIGQSTVDMQDYYCEKHTPALGIQTRDKAEERVQDEANATVSFSTRKDAPASVEEETTEIEFGPVNDACHAVSSVRTGGGNNESRARRDDVRGSKNIFFGSHRLSPVNKVRSCDCGMESRSFGIVQDAGAEQRALSAAGGRKGRGLRGVGGTCSWGSPRAKEESVIVQQQTSRGNDFELYSTTHTHIPLCPSPSGSQSLMQQLVLLHPVTSSGGQVEEFPLVSTFSYHEEPKSMVSSTSSTEGFPIRRHGRLTEEGVQGKNEPENGGGDSHSATQVLPVSSATWEKGLTRAGHERSADQNTFTSPEEGSSTSIFPAKVSQSLKDQSSFYRSARIDTLRQFKKRNMNLNQYATSSVVMESSGSFLLGDRRENPPSPSIRSVPYANDTLILPLAPNGTVFASTPKNGSAPFQSYSPSSSLPRVVQKKDSSLPQRSCTSIQSASTLHFGSSYVTSFHHHISSSSLGDYSKFSNGPGRKLKFVALQRMKQLPMYTRRELEQVFVSHPLSTNVSFDHAFLLIAIFYTAENLLFEPLTKGEQDNIYGCLAKAFGVANNGMPAYLAVHGALRFISQNDEMIEAVWGEEGQQAILR